MRGYVAIIGRLLSNTCRSPPMMTTAPETAFRQRFCHAEHCRRRFFLCTRCDRGQLYCSLDCRHRSRLDQLRAARQRHQQSPEGRLDHRDRQRSYRLRQARSRLLQAQKSVTDQGSKPDLTSDTIATLHFRTRMEPLRPPAQRGGGSGSVVCHFCGRRGRFLDPFHEPG